MQAVQANIIAAQAAQAMLIRAPVSLRQESCAGEPRAGICDPAAVTALAQGYAGQELNHLGMASSHPSWILQRQDTTLGYLEQDLLALK